MINTKFNRIFPFGFELARREKPQPFFMHFNQITLQTNENQPFHCSQTGYCLSSYFFFLFENKAKRKYSNKHTHLRSAAQIKKWCIDGAMQPNYKLLQAVTLIPIRLFGRFSISLIRLLRNVPVLPRFRHLFMWFLLFGSRVDVYVGSIKRNRKEIHRSSFIGRHCSCKLLLFYPRIFHHL